MRTVVGPAIRGAVELEMLAGAELAAKAAAGLAVQAAAGLAVQAAVELEVRGAAPGAAAASAFLRAQVILPLSSDDEHP